MSSIGNALDFPSLIICSYILVYGTVYGIDLICKIHAFGFVSPSMSIRALILRSPEPVSHIDLIASGSSTMSHPVGKSGYIMMSGSLGSFISFAIKSTMSLQLYGGIHAANPNPIPAVPLTRMFGNLLGRYFGSVTPVSCSSIWRTFSE